MDRAIARRIVAVVALAVIAAAVAWVSVPFKDRSVNCGTAIAMHAVTAPNVTSPTGGIVTLCRGPARARVAVSAGALVVAVVGLTWSRRRWRDPPL